MLDYAAGPTQCGTVYSLALPCTWGGVSLSASVLQQGDMGSATTPHSDGACGFLKFWSLNLTGKLRCSGWCSAPLPARAGCLSVGSVGDIPTRPVMREEPPAQPSRGGGMGDATFESVQEGLRAWPDIELA